MSLSSDYNQPLSRRVETMKVSIVGHQNNQRFISVPGYMAESLLHPPAEVLSLRLVSMIIVVGEVEENHSILIATDNDEQQHTQSTLEPSSSVIR